MKRRPLARNVLAAVSLVAMSLGCGGGRGPAQPGAALARQRSAARGSGDAEVVGRWALAEMFSPGGDAKEGAVARQRLASLRGKGLYASLAAAINDETHGDPRQAAGGYIDALDAAKTSDERVAPLASWYAAHHLLMLRRSVAELYTANKARLDALLAAPGRIGWRAVAELVEWSTAEAFDKGEANGDAFDALVTERLGCARAMRIAGPFGHGSAPDRRRAFGPESPGPWPAAWPEDPMRDTLPHVLKVEQHRCFAASTEHVEDGVFYVETFFTAPFARDVLLAVQGSLAVWVDDVKVLDRDLRDWGIWQKFGVAVNVGPGRHRVVARVMGEGSSVRVLNLDGTPARLVTDDDDHAPYVLAPPAPLPDPNLLEPYVHAVAVHDGSGDPQPPPPPPLAPLEAALASFVAHVESLDDLATVLIGPTIAGEDAAALALEHAAQYAKGDLALPDEVRQHTEKDLRTRAVTKDGRLWFSRAWLVLAEAEQRGLVEGVEPMRKLAEDAPGEPEVLEGLAKLYARLGWSAERDAAFADLARRFPDDVNALRLYLGALDEDGPVAEADRIAARIKKLDADTEIDLDRALARHDWKAAVLELRRLGKRRPDRKEIAARIADVLARAGDPGAAAEQLTRALQKNPEDAAARFQLADQAYAKGDTAALRHALAEALQVGAKGQELRDAIDLLEGATDLEPYRKDGRAVIRAFEAWEKKGHAMAGTAARVLDFSAVWVHSDASSEMLEHEIVRIQSQEAIGEESEQRPPAGLVLHLRVIKKDGSILEPEAVAGKPTVSMPHLEVGDYVEIEHVIPAAGDGQRGRHYVGPRWLFREVNKGYWRSEFVMVTPKDKPLEIETRGKVPAIEVSEARSLVLRRWRADESPPAPEEPDSVDPVEFLPSVAVGWGISLDDTLAPLVDRVSEEAPLDPRLHARALEIVRGIPTSKTEERARRLYTEVLSVVQDGNETDGRRAFTGKSGSRQAAFRYLLRELGIPVDVAIVNNRLAPPPASKLSEVDGYDSLVDRIHTEQGVRWLTVGDRFADYGYLAPELRGQPAVVLVTGTPHETTPSASTSEGLGIRGSADLKEDGSATIDLTLSFGGKIGILLRNNLDRLADARLRDFVESGLLGRYVPGARLREVKVENKGDLSLPITLHMSAETSRLGQPGAGEMRLKPLFPVHLSQFAALPERQTPRMLGTYARGDYRHDDLRFDMDAHVDIDFEVRLPPALKLPATLPGLDLKDGDRIARVKDVVRGRSVVFRRRVDLPPGRVAPGADYARFQGFVQAADAGFEREIVLRR